MSNRLKKSNNKSLKLLWYGVGRVPPAKLWAGRRLGGLLSVRTNKREGKVLRTRHKG